MADIATLREALEARLATIGGLRTYEFIPDQINVPCAVVGFPGVDYLQAMRANTIRADFPVRVYVSRATDRAAQAALLAYMAPTGTSSIRAAIDGDNTLAGNASFAVVKSAAPPGVYSVGGVDYLGVEFTVDVMA